MTFYLFIPGPFKQQRFKFWICFLAGTFWGDPHFNTLDGKNFTFNGLGEYSLLNIETVNVTFYLQARTERALRQDGSLSDATVFSAFAAKDHSNASIHVELNVAKDGKDFISVVYLIIKQRLQQYTFHVKRL